MQNLPIEFANWPTACTSRADKAPAAVGPSAGAGSGECIPATRTSFTIPADLLAQVDQFAGAMKWSRAHALRVIVQGAFQ
jgi:hypothetical protein